LPSPRIDITSIDVFSDGCGGGVKLWIDHCLCFTSERRYVFCHDAFLSCVDQTIEFSSQKTIIDYSGGGSWTNTNVFTLLTNTHGPMTGRS